MKLALLIIFSAIFLFGILPLFIMSYYIYRVLLVRTYPEKWEKESALLVDDETVEMNRIGDEWETENSQYKKEVSVVSEGLRLFGEYFDFGYDRSVIIIPGRMESHEYSYFFALPYKNAGCNVLVIDNRAHGKSQGKCSNVGFREQNDIIAWGKMLTEEYGVKHIVLHGICIGAATAVYAMTNENKLENIDCLITEGMYTSFYHSFVNHMLLDKRPVFPFALITMGWLALFSKGKPITDGPEKRMAKLDKPALFMHSWEDQYSLPEASKEMYEKCNSYHVTKWFQIGEHSRIKINNLEEYDREIANFLNTVYKDVLI